MIPVYEAVYREGETQGIYALSVVENPAMQDLWVALSEQPQKVEFSEVDNDKRLLLGAVLIPNKKIYRNIEGNEFYMTFNESTIEQLAHNFFKSQSNNNSSLEHEVKLEGMSVVEGWIVEDSNKDKSNLYGKTYEKGTFVAMMKVDNDDVWNRVKSGEIKGFSIDALLGLEKINLKQIEMTEEVKTTLKDDILNGIKALFQSQKEEEIEVVEEEVVEETTEEVSEETTDQDFDVEAFKKEILDEATAEFAEYKKEIESKLEVEKNLVTELKAQLDNKPAKEEIVVTPKETKVEFKDMTNYEKMQYNRANR